MNKYNVRMYYLGQHLPEKVPDEGGFVVGGTVEGNQGYPAHI